jgi:hypothetical protein
MSFQRSADVATSRYRVRHPYPRVGVPTIIPPARRRVETAPRRALNLRQWRAGLAMPAETATRPRLTAKDINGSPTTGIDCFPAPPCDRGRCRLDCGSPAPGPFSGPRRDWTAGGRRRRAERSRQWTTAPRFIRSSRSRWTADAWKSRVRLAASRLSMRSMFFGSDAGGATAAVLASFTETCQRARHQPMDLPRGRADPYAELPGRTTGRLLARPLGRGIHRGLRG